MKLSVVLKCMDVCDEKATCLAAWWTGTKNTLLNAFFSCGLRDLFSASASCASVDQSCDQRDCVSAFTLYSCVLSTSVFSDLEHCTYIVSHPESGSSSGATRVPNQPKTIPSPRGMPCRDPELPLDTRNTMGTSGNFLESLLAREGPSSALFEKSWNLAPFSCQQGRATTGNIMEHVRGVRQESRRVRQYQHHVFFFFSGRRNREHPKSYWGAYSHSGMMDDPRFPISGMHLGKFLDSLAFQSWKVNFKTEVCSKTADPHITMHWIKEVETAKSRDDLMTSQSIVERSDFTDYDMLDAASALKKLLTHVHFRKRVSVEEQRAQQYDRVLRGRQIAYMIYWLFRATGADEAVTRSIRFVQ